MSARVVPGQLRVQRHAQIRPREQAVLGEPPFVATDFRHSERPDGPSDPRRHWSIAADHRLQDSASKGSIA